MLEGVEQDPKIACPAWIKQAKMNPTPPDSRLGDTRETLSSIGVFGGWRGSDGPHKMEQKARMRLLKAEERVAATLSAYTKSRDATIALPAGEKFHQSIVTGNPKERRHKCSCFRAASTLREAFLL